MKCKQCGNKTQVIRTIRLPNATIRIRKCPRCKCTFSTKETA